MSQSPVPRRKGLPIPVIVIGTTVFIALVCLMIYGVVRSGDPNRDILPSVLIDKPAPEFSLPVLHDPGRHVSSADLRGAPYLLNVWGSWCPSCRIEHPTLTRFAETKRVRVVGYNWKDDNSDALRWLEQFGNPYIVVVTDQDGRKALDWGISAAPETFLIDGDGVIRWKYSGPLTDEIINEQLIPILAKAERGP
ncbi:MAG: DsbE family thiol:disulfide interchange protein [Xanthomonadaceae bacterium]|jgi:cytochrome c biogenesis protein CcmG/thiol:disulfide interchange protein DsbE|nr:DsbE family thiol:disulfide interchange protein [Xanthomonadaceae bacterium]